MDLTPRAWRTSSYSGANNGNCVEVASAARAVAVRDSKDPEGPRLTVSAGHWRQLTRRLRKA